MIVLFGANGQLGSFLKTAIQTQRIHLKMYSWNESQIIDFSREAETWQTETNVLFCNGLTNPKLPAISLNEANLEFPKRVFNEVNKAKKFEKLRFVSIGSVFEEFPQIVARNPYLASKFGLSQWVEAEQESGTWLHVRAHTLYGGQKWSPHMFTGQIIESLKHKTPFQMTLGNQLREYHHAEDIADALLRLLQLNKPWDRRTIHLSSGKPLKLADLAKTIFQQADQTDLLKLGALQEPLTENQDRIFDRTDTSVMPGFRGSPQEVANWVMSISVKDI